MVYADVLSLLRAAALAGEWPAISAGRERVLVGCGEPPTKCMTLGRPPQEQGRRGGKGRRSRVLPGTRAFPALAAAVFELEATLGPNRPPSSVCAVDLNAVYTPHCSVSVPSEGSSMLMVSLGEHEGGDLVVEGHLHRVRYAPFEFDGWRRTHWTTEFRGERFGLVWSTPSADAFAQRAERVVASLRPALRYRPRSTDLNVILEVLGPRPAYAGPPRGDPRWAAVDFSPSGHVVLDVGAHIGAFGRYALDRGASRVIAYEPEPENAALLRANLADAVRARRAQVVQAAVAPRAGEAQLVLGRERSDGVQNTWRHALAGLTHYAEGQSGDAGGGTEGDKPPAGALRRVEVRTVPLFGAGGALGEDVTFVKLDAEGAELELLADPPAGAWRGVTRVVFEWSFTKERSMAAFARAVAALEREGFTVMYEGKGNWERMREWKWHMDALVFAARD